MSNKEIGFTLISNDSDTSSNQQYEKNNSNYDWSSLSIGNSKRIKECCTKDLMGFEFDSIEDAEKFYNTYFSVWKDDIRYYKNGTISMRRWVCSSYTKQNIQPILENINDKQVWVIS